MGSVGSLLVAAVLLWRVSPAQALRQVVAREVGRAIGCSVRIGGVGVTGLGHVIITDVRVSHPTAFGKGEWIHLPSVVIRYSIPRMVLNKEVVAGAYRIDVANPELVIHRNRADRWNILSLQFPTGNTGATPTFKGRLYVTNLTIRYRDDHGWGPRPQRFRTEITHLNAMMDFANPRLVRMVGSGQMAHHGTVALNGSMDLHTGSYGWVIQVHQFDMGIWGPYVLAGTPLHTPQGRGDATLTIRNNDAPGLPFRVHLTTRVSHTTLHLSPFKAPIQHASGTAVLTTARLSPATLMGDANLSRPMAETLHQWLRQHQWLDANSRVMRSPRTPAAWASLPVPASHREAVVRLLRNPPQHLYFWLENGRLGQAVVRGKGALSLGQQTVAIRLYSPRFDFKSLGALFPTLRPWSLVLQGPTTMMLTGHTHDPHIQGHITPAKGSWQGLSLGGPIGFTYHRHALTIDAPHTVIDKAPATVRVVVTFGQETSLNAHCSVRGVPLSRWGGDGLVSANLRLNGGVHRLEMGLHADGPVRWKGQVIHRMVAKGWWLNGSDLRLDAAHYWVNDSVMPLTMMGLIQPAATHLLIEATQLSVRAHQTLPSGVITAKVLVGFPTHQWQANRPLDRLHATFNTQIRTLSLDGDTVDSIETVGTFRDDVVTIDTARIITGLGSVAIKGAFQAGWPTHLSMQASGFRIGPTSMLQRWVPPTFKPFQGVLSGDISLERVSPSENGWHQLAGRGHMRIENGMVKGQPFDQAMIKANWQEGHVTISEAWVYTPQSTILVSGTVAPDGFMRVGLVSPKLALSDLVLPKVPPLKGNGSLTAAISGLISSPTITISMNATAVQVGDVAIRSIQGKGVFERDRIALQHMVIQPQNGQLILDGFWARQGTQWTQARYDLSIDVAPMQLAEMVVFIDSIRSEWRAHQQPNEAVPLSGSVAPNTPLFIRHDVWFGHLPHPQGVMYDDQSEGHSLAYYDTVLKQYQAGLPKAETPASMAWAGELSGSLRAKSNAGELPVIQAQFKLSGFEWGGVSGESMVLRIQSQPQQTNFALMVKSGSVGSGIMDELWVNGFYDTKGYLHIASSQLSRGDERHQVITGTFPLSAYWQEAHANHPMDLSLHWVGSDIGILSVLIPHLSNITNEGEVLVRLTGTLDAPVFNSSKVILKKATVTLNEDSTPLRSPIAIESGSLKIENNTVIISQLGLKWQGADTQKLNSATHEVNRLVVNGTVAFPAIGFRRLSALPLQLALQVETSQLAIHFPGLYRGMVSLEGFTVNGVYRIPLSDTEKQAALSVVGTSQETGPVLGGSLTVYDAEISMPTTETKPPKPGFLLRLSGKIAQNVRLVGGVIGKGLVGNVANQFDVRLAPTDTPLDIRGSLNAPAIQHPITIAGGTIDVLTRRFELLSEDKQRLYNRHPQTQPYPNTVTFQTDYSGPKNKLIPMIKVAALAIIEPLTSVVVSPSVTATGSQGLAPYTHVLITIDGSAYQLEGFSFHHYVAPKLDAANLTYKGTYRLGGAMGSDADPTMIASMLAPELMGEWQSGGPSSVLWRQLGSGTINSLFSQTLLRGIEKEIAKNTGLDQFSIDYNIGKALVDSSATQTVGFNMIKSLFSNKLFIRARTDLDVDRRRNVEPFQLSEIELTYYLERYLSLNYANFLDDTGKSRNRYNVKYSYAY